MLLTLFFVSYVSMKFERSLVKSFFFRQFSVGFTYFRSVSCFVKLDPNFSICITLLQTIINVYYARLYDRSKVSLKLIYYALLLNTMHSRKNMQTCFKLDENGTKQNKKYTSYLFGFYSTRKWVLKSTTRFTLTLSVLNIDPSNLYHILWVPNRLKEC